MRDLALLLTRVIVGGIFTAHGYPKLFGGPGKPVSEAARRWLGSGFVQAMEHGGLDNFATTIRNLGVPLPRTMALIVGLIEFGGGLLVALGLLTRPSALLLGTEMAVVSWRVHARNGLMAPNGFEFPLSLLASCLALIATGPGRLSASHLIAGTTKPQPAQKGLAGLFCR